MKLAMIKERRALDKFRRHGMFNQMLTSLFHNAIISLQLGLEDFSTGKDERLLSAARNLHAGILLLYKEKLLRLSPSSSDGVLLKATTGFKKAADGDLVCVGRGKKTADVATIELRFEELVYCP
ncbi:MAG: hypothetical protein ACP5O1_07140 [Phycisphaerae bacterium]